MALKDLTTPTMVTITAAWLDENGQRPALEKLRRVKPLLPDIEAAHTGLLKSQKKESASSAALAKLDAKATELDTRHDKKARGLFNVMTGLGDLIEDEELAQAVMTARDELMPSGLTITTKSYLDEAGEAALVDERLSPASKKVLKQVAVAGMPLSKWVDAWLDPARELGQVERERIKLQGKIEGEPVQGGSPVRARNEWIRTISAVLQMIELERDLDPAMKRGLLEHLDNALAKASRRAARAKSAAQPEAPNPDGNASSKNAGATGAAPDASTKDASPKDAGAKDPSPKDASPQNATPKDQSTG